MRESAIGHYYYFFFSMSCLTAPDVFARINSDPVSFSLWVRLSFLHIPTQTIGKRKNPSESQDPETVKENHVI